MSLMRLLSSGRCWVGLKESSHYRMTDPRAMPKFGSGKNCFSGTTTKAEPARMPARPGSDGNYWVTKAEPARMPALPGEKGTSGLSPGGRAGTNHPAQGEAGQMQAHASVGMISTLRNSAVRVSSSVGSYIKALRPGTAALLGKLSSLIPRRRSRPKTSALAGFAKAPLQGELSLDRIKVVRNDLSDVDLEIVRTSEKPAPATSATPALAAAPLRTVPETEQTAWNRITTGLLGEGKT
jgi:hypothetical protein